MVWHFPLPSMKSFKRNEAASFQGYRYFLRTFPFQRNLNVFDILDVIRHDNAGKREITSTSTFWTCQMLLGPPVLANSKSRRL